MNRWLLLAALAVAMAGCKQAVAPSPHPHYLLGSPYQSGGAWHYPRENDDLDQTGLAEVYPAGHPPLTSNDELFDQGAMAAAHPTLQLPAIARVTNLETGRAVLVRINDRGSATPHRLIEITTRVATLLGMGANPVARVRLQVLPVQSHAAVEAMPDAPHLAVEAAPRGVVEVAELPPPPGARGGSGHAVTRRRADGVEPTADEVPLRLPETVTQARPTPGRLWVRLDSFEEYQYAAVLRARLIGLEPRIIRVGSGRTTQFQVAVGPIDDVDRADRVLDQALGAGVPDAHIVVE